MNNDFSFFNAFNKNTQATIIDYQKCYSYFITHSLYWKDENYQCVIFYRELKFKQGRKKIYTDIFVVFDNWYFKTASLTDDEAKKLGPYYCLYK